MNVLEISRNVIGFHLFETRFRFRFRQITEIRFFEKINFFKFWWAPKTLLGLRNLTFGWVIHIKLLEPSHNLGDFHG